MLPVNQPYAELLVNGIKTIEWRKKPLPTGKAYIYETKNGGGRGLVIGEVEIGAGFYENAETISDKLIKYGCISKDLLKQYAKGKPIFANLIWIATKYKYPMPLSCFGLSRPPQSFCYLKQ